MSKQKKLTKVIERAVKRGFDMEIVELLYEDGKFWIIETDKNIFHLNDILFSHDFAKAYWGEKDKWHETKCTCGGADFHASGHDSHYEGCAKIKADRGYIHHLQQAVLSKDPIDYYYKNK